MRYYSRPCTFLGMKQGVDDPVVKFECDIFNVCAYVDILRSCLNDDKFDYIVIEPYKLKSLFPDEIF